MDSKVFCIFASHYLPYLGGVERYTYNVSRELCDRGHKVVIVTSSMEGQASYEEKEGITIVRLPSIELLGGRFPVLKYCKETVRLLKKLDGISIDYVLINTRFYVLSAFAARYARKRKLKSLVIEHGTGHFTVNNMFWDMAGHIYEHFITSVVARYCNDFCGVSLECNCWLEHFKIKAKGVTYNAIDIEHIMSLYDREDDYLEKEFGLSENDLIITYTGRLVKEKGIDKLLEAFVSIKKKYPLSKLCIAGDGDLYNDIRDRAWEGVVLLGRLEFEQVIQLLKRSVVFCLPTDYPEGLPTSVLEALACKVYVVTTRSGGAKEVIISDSYGKILQENSVNEIEVAICNALQDENMRMEVVANAYSRVANEFSWKKTVDSIIENVKG